MENTMELSAQTLETIGQYVQRNLSTWLRDANLERELALRERTVRVEEELKAQRELMREGFAHMDKRFEQVDKRIEIMQDSIDKRFEQVDKRFEQVDRRFEQVDKRFEQIDKRFEEMGRNNTRWFTVLSLMLAILGAFLLCSPYSVPLQPSASLCRVLHLLRAPSASDTGEAEGPQARARPRCPERSDRCIRRRRQNRQAQDRIPPPRGLPGQSPG